MGIIGAAAKAAATHAADGAGAVAGHAVEGTRAIRHFAAEQSEIIDGLRDVRRLVRRERREEQIQQAGEQVATQPPESDDSADSTGIEADTEITLPEDDGGILKALFEWLGELF